MYSATIKSERRVPRVTDVNKQAIHKRKTLLQRAKSTGDPPPPKIWQVMNSRGTM